MPDEKGAHDQEILCSLRKLLEDLGEITQLLQVLVDGYESHPTPPHTFIKTPQNPSSGREEALTVFLDRETESFTERESEVFNLLLTGMSNRQIGRSLGIAERTVKNNLHSIYRKLGVSSRAEAMTRFFSASAAWRGTDSGA
ncbi:response regulator transcription factor [Streptomyces sp. AM 4-1-1]|uniref:response regulator transcription factor n=1 Tax=Streptomyces sp. AM 4-1-1 TaxID=3028710 RepID=UPI0023B94663|nr:response regulator transcription factor [Streptomyces sp. AM 4-1-1]WEH37007.1 response regulator transcription factor [Streptomyces sp. AM 4-1-1]